MRFVLPLFCLLALTAGSVSAEIVIDSIELPDFACSEPSVAVSDQGLAMIAFTTQGALEMSFIQTQLLPTHPQTGVPWPEPVGMGAGGSAKVCWSYDGFTLAVANGHFIRVYHSDLAGNWDLENVAELPAGGEVMTMDLWGVPSDAAGPNAFLTWSTPAGTWQTGGRIHYAARTYWGWTTPEEVAESPETFPWPQLTWGIGPAGPVPRLFYLTGEPGQQQMMVTTRTVETGWTAPEEVPGGEPGVPSPYGGEFDVVIPWDLNRHLLGNGPQPACPCNLLYHQQYLPGQGWLAPDEITDDYASFDWPMSPCLAVRPDSRVQAFWVQRAYSGELEALNSYLEYREFDGSSWQDIGGELAAQNGRNLGWRVDLDISPDDWPVLAWTRNDTIDGVPWPEQVWVARPTAPSPVLDDVSARRYPGLEAWPNPFNPQVELAFSLDQAGSVHLEVFDARGRRVAVLVDEYLNAGPHAMAWDGRDTAGRALPSGVYFAKLVSEELQVTQKLVLTR